jgi:DNA-binding response OmpR family regulator
MPRILIVEDDPAIAVALEDDLRLEGYEVEVVHEGESASRRAREAAFDVVLLDVMLPKKDGFEVCREIRRAGRDCRILMLTARAQESDSVLGLDLGADDYVTKPYSPKTLRARIRALLRRGVVETQDDQVVAFGECELDVRRAELRRGGRPVPVTPLEFKLLELFTRRAGRVFTRRALIDEVWGMSTAVTERVVDNQIANLRKKIEADPARPRHLVSVRSIGYRFDLEQMTGM